MSRLYVEKGTRPAQLHIPGRSKATRVTLRYFLVEGEEHLWVGCVPLSFLETPERNAVKKAMQVFEGRKYFHTEYGGPTWWDKDEHFYGFPLNPRNEFQLELLQGKNPYAHYDKPDSEFKTESGRSLYKHQQSMLNFVLSKRYCILAAEQGTGKSLVMIEAIEHLRRTEGVKMNEIMYVAPKVGIEAVALELDKWDSELKGLKLTTYDGMRKKMRLWLAGTPAPKIVVFDESSKLKTWGIKRSKAALKLANAVRLEHGDKGLVVEMSGTPSPKTPVDWFSQCEIARPGFLKEPNAEMFKARMTVTEKRPGMAGGNYMHLVTFLDNPNKCRYCGKFENDEQHRGKQLARIPKVWPPDLPFGEEPPVIGNHYHEESINEVLFLAERMKGLVQVTYKKDCLDIPDKIYKQIRVKPTPNTMKAYQLLRKTAKSAISFLTRARQMSDGFNYVQEETGNMLKCPTCEGKCTVANPIYEEYTKDYIEDNQAIGFADQDEDKPSLTTEEIMCDLCGGEGVIPQMQRGISEIECPKDDALRAILVENEDVGRIVVWGGFTGTIQRITAILLQQGWNVLQITGGGWTVNMADPNAEAPDIQTMLKAMDGSHPRRYELAEQLEKVAIVGNPLAGGMGLTATAAQIAVYYSNVFNGEARMQSEDRIHRLGIPENRSPIIYDIIHLQSDIVVLNNLKTKKRLQDMSMGELESQIDIADQETIKFRKS